ncbi:MAG TPA: hypothetical protein VG406_13340 [Isosphaeraceae bacterium]|jgi:hypothetical protein|nr:hypothetical protein [Isosphaeraceae bacterium]
MNTPDLAPDDPRRAWARRLGRLRLGAEPLSVQLERYRRTTWALTIVCSIVAAMFFAIFTAFRRPDLGALFATILFAPVIALSWLDFARHRARALAYIREFGDEGGKGDKVILDDL